MAGLERMTTGSVAKRRNLSRHIGRHLTLNLNKLKFVIYDYSEEFSCGYTIKVIALFCITTSCPVVLNLAR